MQHAADEANEAAPVDDAAAVEVVQPTGDVDSDVTAAAAPPELVVLVGCQRVPQVTALRIH